MAAWRLAPSRNPIAPRSIASFTSHHAGSPNASSSVSLTSTVHAVPSKSTRIAFTGSIREGYPTSSRFPGSLEQPVADRLGERARFCRTDLGRLALLPGQGGVDQLAVLHTVARPRAALDLGADHSLLQVSPRA